MTELLPCPFCGDEAEKGRQAVTQMNAERTTFDRIICRCCGAMAPELNWQKRAPSTPAADKEAMDMILAHAIPGAATQAPASGKASEPFLYAIMGPDGTAHIDEQCVSSARGDLDDTVFSLNEVSGPYRVVELFVPVQPAAAAPETFESFWAKLPIPGEYDNMDPIDQRRWRDVVRQAFDHVADANKMVADGWIACADRLPDLDVPVFGTAGMGISVYMRYDGADGWLWARQTWVHDLASLQGFECDDDYEVTHWRPMVALPVLALKEAP